MVLLAGPFLLHLALATLAAHIAPGDAPLLVSYAVRLAIVAAALWRLHRCLPQLLPLPRDLLPGRLGLYAVLGVLLAASWVALGRIAPRFELAGQRRALDPFAAFPSLLPLVAFLVLPSWTSC